MKIEKTEVFVLKVPTGQRLRTAIHDISDVYNVFIRLTAGGVSGHGYAFSFSEHQAAALAGLLKDLGQAVEGQDAAPSVLESVADRRLNFVGTLGPSMLARSALDIAAWDLLARSRQAPLYNLLGGSDRRMPAYATGGWVDYSREQTLEEAQTFYAQGYRRYKIKIGSDTRGFDADLKRSVELRDALPPDMEVMVDANQAWSVAVARRALQAFAGEGFAWFEEPIDAADYAGYSQLREMGLGTIAAGETLHGETALIELSARNGVDVLMPDIMRVGGVSGFRRVLEGAERLGVAVSSHTFTSVSTHVMTLSTLGGPVEVLPTWWDQVFEEAPDVVDGDIRPSNSPGASSTPSEEAVSRWMLA